MPFSLSVPDTSRERRDSTNSHIANSTDGLRNINVNDTITYNMNLTPQSRTTRQLPYIATQRRGEMATSTTEAGKRYYFLRLKILRFHLVSDSTASRSPKSP